MLDRRLKRMEDRVIKMIPEDPSTNNDVLPRAILKPAAAQALPKVAVPDKRSSAEAFGPDLDRWAQKSGQQDGPSSSKGIAVPKSKEQEEDSSLTEGKELLPPFEIQEHLAETYFDYVYGQIYYLLHKPSYMQKLRAGKVPPVLNLAVCGISARFSTHPDLQTEPTFLRGDHWAKAAQDLALKRFDRPSLSIVMVFILLGLHTFGTCQGAGSWMTGGLAHRMVYALRLHKDPPDDSIAVGFETGTRLTFIDREIRRRCTWSAFMMDRFISSGTERPMFAREDHMHLKLPVKEEYFQLGIPGETEALNTYLESPQVGNESNAKVSDMGVAAFNIRVVALWGHLVQYLNLGGRLKDDFAMWSPRSEWYKLSERINAFKASLPSHLVWSKENLESHHAKGTANQFLFLHIAYNQVILFLHRYAFPAIAMYQPCVGEPISFVNNGKAAAIEAATMISKLVALAVRHRVVAPFTGYSAYMSSAIHIYGFFSNNKDHEKKSKDCLATNIKFIQELGAYWGTFPFLLENLKELFRLIGDAARKGSDIPHPDTPQDRKIYQYGDWHERYPRGVSRTDYQDPVTRSDDSHQDPILSQQSDLQSVEEFFNTSSPKPISVPKSKARKKGSQRKSSQNEDAQASQDSQKKSQPLSQRDGMKHSNRTQRPERSSSAFGIPERFDRSPASQGLSEVQEPQQIGQGMAFQRASETDDQPTVPPAAMPFPHQQMPNTSSFDGINYETSSQPWNIQWGTAASDMFTSGMTGPHAWMMPASQMEMPNFENINAGEFDPEIDPSLWLLNNQRNFPIFNQGENGNGTN